MIPVQRKGVWDAVEATEQAGAGGRCRHGQGIGQGIGRRAVHVRGYGVTGPGWVYVLTHPAWDKLGVVKGSVKNLGRYAASWIAWWPNRPSSTAALT